MLPVTGHAWICMGHLNFPFPCNNVDPQAVSGMPCSHLVKSPVGSWASVMVTGVWTCMCTEIATRIVARAHVQICPLLQNAPLRYCTPGHQPPNPNGCKKQRGPFSYCCPLLNQKLWIFLHGAMSWGAILMGNSWCKAFNMCFLLLIFRTYQHQFLCMITG